MANAIKGVMPGVTGTYSSDDGELNFKTSLAYRVEVDQIVFDSTYPMSTSGLPVVNYTTITLANGLQAVCRNKSATQDKKNRLIWTVRCDFDTAAQGSSDEDSSEEQQTGDPTGWTPRINIKFEEFEEYSATDLDGKPYMTSAGEPLGSGFPVKKDILVWNFTQYESASLDSDTLSLRNGALNNAAWRNYAEKTWKCQISNAVLGKKNGYDCWKIDYILKYKADNWLKKALDVGTYYLDGSSNKIPFKDEYENRIFGTLDGSGGEETTPEDVAVLEFRQNELTSFSFIRAG